MNSTRWQEICLGLMAVHWGLILIMPGDLFVSVERYKDLNEYMPDHAWGILMIICGLICVTKYPPWLRKEAHFGLCFIWGFITVLIFLDGFSITLVLLTDPFVTIAILHGYLFFRLPRWKRDTRAKDGAE